MRKDIRNPKPTSNMVMMSRAAAYLGRAPVSRVATRVFSNVRVAALSSLRRCLHGLSTPQPRRRRDHLRKLRAGDSTLPSSWDALGIWPRAQTRRRSLGTSQRRGDAFFPTWCESMRLSGLPASGEQNGGLKSAEWGPAPGETARWRHSPMFRRHRRAMFNGLGTTRSLQYFNLSSPLNGRTQVRRRLGLWRRAGNGLWRFVEA